MARIITVANEKGGVGKTTACRNLGAALNDKGFKVLLVDLNHQVNLTLSVGIEDTDSIKTTICDGMNAVFDGTAVPSGLILTHNGINIIPANKNLVLTKVNLACKAGGDGILRELLFPLRQVYDYILIDTGPTMADSQ